MATKKKSSTGKILDYLQSEIPSEEKVKQKAKRKRAAKMPAEGNMLASALDEEALPEDEEDFLGGQEPTQISGSNVRKKPPMGMA